MTGMSSVTAFLGWALVPCFLRGGEGLGSAWETGKCSFFADNGILGTQNKLICQAPIAILIK